MQRNDNSISMLKCFRTFTGVYRNHRHLPNIMELIYVIDGSAKHILEGVENTITVGDYFVVDAGASHAYPEVPGGMLGMIVCRFNMDNLDMHTGSAKNFTELLTSRFPSEDITVDNTRIYHDEDGSVLKLFESILTECSSQHTAYADKITCLLTEIFIAILREYDTNNGTSMSRAVKYAADYTNTHFSDNISLLELSRQLYVSHSWLSQNFKKEVGVSFNAYLQNRRISAACNLLAHSESSVEQISETVGYSDTKYFREVFKRIVGCTPREFRSRMNRSRMCKYSKVCLAENRYDTCDLRRFCIHYL